MRVPGPGTPVDSGREQMGLAIVAPPPLRLEAGAQPEADAVLGIAVLACGLAPRGVEPEFRRVRAVLGQVEPPAEARVPLAVRQPEA